MLVELNQVDERGPIAINPLAIYAAVPARFKSKEATRLWIGGGTEDHEFLVAEDFATVRQRWAEALGN